MLLSRKASCDSHGEDSSYFLGWQEYEKNPYHQHHNPKGIIQMGLAENQLSFDLLESWLASNSDEFGFKTNGVSVFKEIALFQDYHGLSAFKNALVEFMATMRGNRIKFDPNKLVLTAGSTSANEILMFCLANPGEAFILPTPYYPGFDRDLQWRTGAKIVPIHCSSINGFRITEAALEQAYNRAQMLNLKVRGVFVTNPSNPLGTTMSRNELNLLIDFAINKNVHIVSDEIFSGTVFDSPNFISISEVVSHRKLEDNDINGRVHIVYSLSKDLGLPGFRVGMIYSNNETLINAATKMSSFSLISAQTQHLLSHMLFDKQFVCNYIHVNKKRLRKTKEVMVAGLRDVGIRCLKSNAGLFCWVDMRHLLAAYTFEAEKELWKKVLYEVGLNITAGSSCHCSEPGWFRICFANMSEKTLSVAMQRIRAFVGSSGKCGNGRSNQRSTAKTKWVFQLASFDDDREPEDR